MQNHTNIAILVELITSDFLHIWAKECHMTQSQHSATAGSQGPVWLAIKTYLKSCYVGIICKTYIIVILHVFNIY